MTTLNVRKPQCPGDQLPKIDPKDLLDRNLLNGTDFHTFVQPWLRKAKTARSRERWFEALIYLWVLFNAWLSRIVSDRDKNEDWYLVQAAGLDPVLSTRFDYLLHADKEFSKLVREFHSLWPVFKVRTLADNDIEPWGAWGNSESRFEYRDKCFSHTLRRKDYAPRCYAEHQSNNSVHSGGDPDCVPLDWSHTLAAIYQVRCNLFHGGKSFRNSKDSVFVRMAFEILWNVWGSEQTEAHSV